MELVLEYRKRPNKRPGRLSLIIGFKEGRLIERSCLKERDVYSHNCNKLNHRRTGRGTGRGGLQPPQILGSERKFGQSQFLKTSPCLFNYFKDLNIKLKSA